VIVNNKGKRAHDLTQRFIYGLLAVRAGAEDNDLGMFNKGVVELLSATRDIASLGELRGIEAEFGDLLVGAIKKNQMRRGR
jgi:hypothetical protein